VDDGADVDVTDPGPADVVDGVDVEVEPGSDAATEIDVDGPEGIDVEVVVVGFGDVEPPAAMEAFKSPKAGANATTTYTATTRATMIKNTRSRAVDDFPIPPPGSRIGPIIKLPLTHLPSDPGGSPTPHRFIRSYLNTGADSALPAGIHSPRMAGFGAVTCTGH
jgi:hypothetical protein